MDTSPFRISIKLKFIPLPALLTRPRMESCVYMKRNSYENDSKKERKTDRKKKKENITSKK